MNAPRNGWRNSFLLGFIPGLFGPVIVALLFWAARYQSQYTFEAWIRTAHQEDALVMLVALGGVINLIIFFILMQFKWYWSARATIIATLLYALVVIILKLG